MSTERYDGALSRAAERCGVQSQFWDIFGRPHEASREAKKAIVRALGIPVSSAEAIEEALYERERVEWEGVLAPTLVLLHAPHGLDFSLTLPESERHHEARFRIFLEDGGSLAADQRPGSEIQERREFGATWVRVPVHLPLDVPLGYHRMELTVGERSAAASLIVTPNAAWQPESLRHGAKSAGLAVSLYGLRSARNWGFGDFTDLRALSRWAARELGVTFIALNPLHAIHNRRPYNSSPYLPISIYFQNSLYLDIETIEEWRSSRRAQRAFHSSEVQTELHLLRESPEVEYERVHALKTRFLKLLFAAFLRKEWRARTPRARRFDRFREEAGEIVERFGLFCALNESLHRTDPDLWIWTDWPKEFQDPASPASREFARKHWRSVLFFQYVAWQASEQLATAQEDAVAAGLEVGLYHDLALATDRYGSDIWAMREFYAPGCRVGSPPDDFSPQGQDWGFPPPHTTRHRADGFRLFRDSIRRICRHGGALRIDHVMRLFRLYWIPDGMDATQGAYVHDYAQDLVRILALESVRHRVLIIGEDLGTVEPYIREMLAQYGILSYRLFFFEKHGDGSYRLPGEYPRQALVSSSTHDLPTLVGFWQGSDIQARRAAGIVDEEGHRNQWADRTRDKQRMLDGLSRAGLLPETYPRDATAIPAMDSVLHDAAIAFLAATPSMLMLVNQEDLTYETQQQNLPGTTAQYPNWGHKMRFTLEQLESDAQAAALSRRMKEQLSAAGRVSA